MYNPPCELSKYGLKRLRKIVAFVKFGGQGYEFLFGSKVWVVDVISSTNKQGLVNAISWCGAFQYIADIYHESWERLLADLVTHKNFVIGLCNLFGMESESKKLQERESNVEIGMAVLQRVVNKLSNVYIFHGDPIHPLSRRRMNDIRLNSLFRKNMFGKEALTIARTVTTFRDAITDPYIRAIFWTNYKPGTGTFAISVSNLDQIVDDDDCCSICLDIFTAVMPGVRLTPCHHIFHPRCIQELIINLGNEDVKCPLCRCTINDL